MALTTAAIALWYFMKFKFGCMVQSFKFAERGFLI